MAKGLLPPDPDNKNDERAEWGEIAIQAFREAVDADIYSALPDLLCDLMHWADRQTDLPSFDEALSRARSHYSEETAAVQSNRENSTRGRRR